MGKPTPATPNPASRLPGGKMPLCSHGGDDSIRSRDHGVPYQRGVRQAATRFHRGRVFTADWPRRTANSPPNFAATRIMVSPRTTAATGASWPASCDAKAAAGVKATRKRRSAGSLRGSFDMRDPRAVSHAPGQGSSFVSGSVLFAPGLGFAGLGKVYGAGRLADEPMVGAGR